MAFKIEYGYPIGVDEYYRISWDTINGEWTPLNEIASVQIGSSMWIGFSKKFLIPWRETVRAIGEEMNVESISTRQR